MTERFNRLDINRLPGTAGGVNNVSAREPVEFPKSQSVRDAFQESLRRQGQDLQRSGARDVEGEAEAEAVYQDGKVDGDEAEEREESTGRVLDVGDML